MGGLWGKVKMCLFYGVLLCVCYLDIKCTVLDTYLYSPVHLCFDSCYKLCHNDNRKKNIGNIIIHIE